MGVCYCFDRCLQLAWACFTVDVHQRDITPLQLERLLIRASRQKRFSLLALSVSFPSFFLKQAFKTQITSSDRRKRYR